MATINSEIIIKADPDTRFSFEPLLEQLIKHIEQINITLIQIEHVLKTKERKV